MDSLTQIVLGAAVGEVLLGRKVGNKAMLWGAVAGTIPDLDVYQSLIFDSLKANELHRGFSHSILFSVIFAPLLAWILVKKEKILLATLVGAILAYPALSSGNPWVIGVLSIVFTVCLYFILKNKYDSDKATKRDWTKLFFWSLFTHPLLDCHTTWGTQLLWPLPHKFAWNNIFVVDPLYTVPFLVCVIIAMCYHRQSSTRTYLNWTGIAISSLYMIWALGVKWYTFNVFEDNLKSKGIVYSRLTTVPTPMNTFLWSATADGDTVLYSGLYSIFDKNKEVEFYTIKTNHNLVNRYSGDDVLDRLNFLSKGWYVIDNDNPDTLVYNDTRFGPMYLGEKPLYSFGYQLTETPEGVKANAQRPELDADQVNKMLSTLWNRIWGK
ncbi:MAG: inner membrane protein [Bacteroidia bacterium]|jgi:inner membrane protein|tara:strand:+ start:1153 stop:2295 length:1143 start_codon:yes stop_codon:yes gene_type:complete